MPTAKKSTTRKKPARATSSAAFPAAPVSAPNSPSKYRARVRMYRHGLGDCFLITIPRKSGAPFQMLIDCGVLARKADFISGMVEHLRETVRHDHPDGKVRLDVVSATHEHKDHVSGFNQARSLFSNDFEFGSVWLAWTENLTVKEVEKIKAAKKKAADTLRAALTSPLGQAAPLAGVAELLAFSEADDASGSGTVGEAMEYLKLRGKDCGDLQFLKPGAPPMELDGVDGVRVYVLGPPLDPLLLKASEVTEKMKTDGTIYHLAATGDAGMDALAAAIPSAGEACERFFPFARQHRIDRSSIHFPSIQPFTSDTYDNPQQAWRRIDSDWMRGFGQLALDLDSDTNNTSLVLAFEFVKTGEVLLFVGDAQVGNWKSWEKVSFQVPGRATPLPAHDLLNRTVFYKVGHHCSHNATLRNGGLELMTREDLVAFIPLDQETAEKQGKTGWEMPAPPLFKALKEKAKQRVVISDIVEKLPAAAKMAGVRSTDAYVDYFLK